MEGNFPLVDIVQSLIFSFKKSGAWAAAIIKILKNKNNIINRTNSVNLQKYTKNM